MIRRAVNSDIPDIESILYDAVVWMKKNNIPNLWNRNTISWREISKSYNIEDFYLYIQNDRPVGCMALKLEDKKYWNEIEPGDSLFLHKLAVKREASGLGISNEMITFAKNLAKTIDISDIRLDCNADREKLRELYEKEGFQCVRTVKDTNGYEMALYVCKI